TIFSWRPWRSLRFLFVVLMASAIPAGGHDLERTSVSLTFARDGSFTLDVSNDPNWLTQRLERFSKPSGATSQTAGRPRPSVLGSQAMFIDRVVLWVDGREIRPSSVEYVPAGSRSATGDGLATYRMRGHVPIDAQTLRWYYGLVVDPYPLTI